MRDTVDKLDKSRGSKIELNSPRSNLPRHCIASISTNGRTTFAPNHNPSESIATPEAMTVHGPERRVASWLTEHNSEVAVTTGARAAEVFGHIASFSYVL